MFGYPTLYFGASVASMGDFQFYDHTKFPNLYSLFGSFERTLLRGDKVSLGYHLDFGVTYNPATYDPVNGEGNNWLSSPFMAYFGAGAFAKVHLGKRWEVGVDAAFRHYSNGRLRLPNEALNAVDRTDLPFPFLGNRGYLLFSYHTRWPTMQESDRSAIFMYPGQGRYCLAVY